MKTADCLGPMYLTPDGSLVVGSSVVVVVVVSISHPTLRFVFGHLPSSLPQVISNVAKSTQSIFLSSSHVYSVYPSSEPSHNLAYLQSLLILSWPLHSQSPMGHSSSPQGHSV